MESNFPRQGAPAVCIALYAWIFSMIAGTTGMTYYEAMPYWNMWGPAFMASVLLSFLTLRLPFDQQYKQMLVHDQPNAVGLAIVLVFAWVLIIVHLLETIKQVLVGWTLLGTRLIKAMKRACIKLYRWVDRLPDRLMETLGW